jgi:hypothetical protein
MEQQNVRRIEPQEQAGLRLKIRDVNTYVGRMTKAAHEGRSLACQGLHNAAVLAYGSSRTVRLAVSGRAL